MESAAPLPASAVVDRGLAEIVARPGPFLSLYLTTERDIDHAARRSETRWRNVRRSLEGDGTPEAVLAAVDDLVADAHLGGPGLVVVADSSGILHVEHEPDPPKADVGRWASLPVLGPLLEWHQGSMTYVVVLIDRKGADIIGFRREQEISRGTADGEDFPIHKPKPGGWSQRRYQQRAENTWMHNAKNVAEAVATIVDDLDPRLVVVAGDVRAVELLRDAVAKHVAERLWVMPGSRAESAAADLVAAEAQRLVATAVATDTRDVLQAFKEHRGQGDRAADGPVATIEALNQARVQLLLVPGDVAAEGPVAYFGAEPLPISAVRGELADLHVPEVREGPLVDVLLRSALLTGAAIRVTPRAGGPLEGIGAILRW